jgi:hypothetical protein
MEDATVRGQLTQLSVGAPIRLTSIVYGSDAPTKEQSAMPAKSDVKQSDVKQRLFTYSETSKILSRGRVSIWRDVKAGRLVLVHIGGSARITGESIDRICAGK